MPYFPKAPFHYLSSSAKMSAVARFFGEKWWLKREKNDDNFAPANLTPHSDMHIAHFVKNFKFLPRGYVSNSSGR